MAIVHHVRIMLCMPFKEHALGAVLTATAAAHVTASLEDPMSKMVRDTIKNQRHSVANAFYEITQVIARRAACQETAHLGWRRRSERE